MIRITVPGRPVPKGRPRLEVRGRKAFVYTPERTVEYERLVGLCAAAARSGDVLECPVAVAIDLYLHKMCIRDRQILRVINRLRKPVLYRCADIRGPA